ncbi:phosphonatase-like hydrolase [Taibaiella sp. KBW10]|uniref:phosphonatase-like hydrolase n=1 Tax=Taibaiella sp. KBW10 TaxID=2153357 RepID=UPI000F59CBD9|nr:phosphonatase-like hydrolase [Taibaiella sp. KBW10]RQO29887.1 phosphonatase-like hydrolase [Taibaiella sp. KBW10]
MQTELIKLAVFDMAGTTVYDDDFVTRALCDALQLHGYSISLSAANEVMGIAKPVAIEMLLDRFYPDATTKNIALIHEDFLRLMIDFYKNAPGICEIEGASQTFRALQDQGIKVGLDTGFSRDITDIIIQRLGWASLLDVSVSSDEVAQGRPYPDMIFKAMDLTGIEDVRQVAKIGDTPVDLEEGHRAGCALVVGVLSGANDKEALQKHPHTHIIDSIVDFTTLLKQERLSPVA